MGNCIEANLKLLLKDSPDVLNLSGGNIVAGNLPAGVAGPAIVIRPINSQPNYSIVGEVGINDSVIQIDCFHSSRPLCHDLAEAVRNRLSGYSGSAGDCEIDNAMIISDATFVDAPRNGSDVWTKNVSVDYRIFYTTSVPTLA